jgi:hypothetical protein
VPESFIAALKRRNVIRVAVGHLAAAWLLLQIADLIRMVGIGFFPADCAPKHID